MATARSSFDGSVRSFSVARPPASVPEGDGSLVSVPPPRLHLGPSSPPPSASQWSPGGWQQRTGDSSVAVPSTPESRVGSRPDGSTAPGDAGVLTLLLATPSQGAPEEDSNPAPLPLATAASSSSAQRPVRSSSVASSVGGHSTAADSVPPVGAAGTPGGSVASRPPRRNPASVRYGGGYHSASGSNAQPQPRQLDTERRR